MKNIIERIAGGGAKIARYLPKAVSTRLAGAALAALAAGGAWATAPTATAVWEAGEFTETKNGYSITLPSGVSIENNNIVVSSTATAGASIDISSVIDGGATAVTVLFKYSTASTPSSSCSMAVSSSYIDSNNANGTKYDMGFINWSTSNWGLLPAWHATSTSSGFNKYSANTPNYTTALSSSGGYVLYAYSKSVSTVYGYSGSTLSNLSGGSKDGYTFSNYDGKITHVGIGGPTGQTPSNKWAVWPGMTIEKIAIFVGNAYTNEDLADYMWPSIERYQKWSYADTSRIVTWTTPSYAIDNCIPAPAASYTVFDISTATDTDTTYTGGAATSTTGANWHYFCYSSSVSDGYAAPGSVLRFVSGDYKKSLAADYSPVTYGGIIVEEGATGYGFASADRYSVLGDPTGATETWFEFNEDFTLGRSSGCHLTGTNNLSIASGKTFTIAGTTTKCATTAKAKNLSGTAGGTLKLHGEGKLVATLTASGATLDYTDLSATCSSSTDAYIQGTVTVDDDTIIALPSGATFPYFIATGISGVLDSETGVTIGGVAAPNYVAMSNGSIIYSAPAEVTISSDATWGSGDLDEWTTDDATKNYIINVTGDATLTLGAAVSLNRLTLSVSEGATLTVSGGYTITAADCIYVTGSGEVATSTAPTFSGTVKGDGTLCYDMNNGTTKPSGIDCTSDDWAGMLWIKNGAYTGWNFNTASGAYIKYGGANSTLRIENVTCYLNATETVGFTLDLHGEGLKITNGNEHKVETVKKLTGSGTLAISGGAANGNGFIIQDGSEFAGSINITTGNYVVNFADSGTYASSTTGGKIIVGSGKSATVASGKTWSTTNQNGIEINGTLTLADSTSTLTGSISGSGTIVANQQFPVPGSSFTGTLTINGDPENGTTTDATAIYGSTLNVASGQVGVTGNVTTLPDTINIASGATFVVLNASLASLSLDIGTWDGMLAFMNCTSLASLTIDAGTKRAFPTTGLTLPNTATLSTVNIVLDEVKGDGGTITLTSATGLTAVEGRTYNFTVNRVDGTTVTGTYDSAASTVSYTPAISGAATDIDWDFTDGEDDALEQAPSGVSKNSDSTMTFSTDATDSTKTGVYIKHHPYITGAASFMGNNSAAMTVAVVGTMPATQNTIFLNVGSAYDQQYGLVFVTTAKANEVLIGYNYGGTVTPITTMTVPNSSTARHSYIVTKVDGSSTTTFTVYLDGIKWKTVTTASKIVFASSNSGVQVGSDFGGNIRQNGYSAASDDVGVLNVLRVYGRIITEAEIAVYASTFPYVSPNGASSRTFATATEDWVEETDTDWTNTDSSGTTTQGTAPSAGASVTVTATETTEITVNLASDTQYEALTINGSATTLAAGSGSGKISVTGMTVIGAPVTVEYGAADFTGGPMTITEDGTITFDYSGYDASAVYAATDVPLTSDVDEDATKVFLIRPVTPYRTYALVYTSGHYVLRITPIANPGSVVYYTGGYWGATETTFSVTNSSGDATIVFPGDTVVIPAYYDGTSAYFGGTLPANVAAISVAKNFAFESGVDNTAILGGATVAVADGCTLSFATSWHNLTLGSVTFNGPGGVTIPSLSRTASISGAVSGTAALTISGTVNVASGGSIANAVAGSGTIAYAAIPAATPSSFTGWTGTVQLPAIASGAIIFNNYGTTGSTVYLTSMSSGAWIQADNTTIDPKLYLAGNMTLSVMSPKTYTFAEIDGPGALSFATSDNQPTAINITKVAEGYSGTISSTLETPVTIATLDRAVETSTAGGTKLLSTSGNVAASALTVGGAAQQVGLCTAADGIYVACTVTILEVAHASAAVTVGGVAAAGSSPYTVDVGSNVEITWTADSGYKITDGATQTIKAIATDVTATAPTVEAKGATVSGVTFSYLDDFAKATVTATVSGDDVEGYTLTVDGKAYAGSVNGTTVTFTDVETGHSSAYDSVDYTIAATDGTAVSGGAGSSVVADVYDWITEDKDNYKATGTWETDIAYDGTTAAATIVDNTYTPTSPSTNDVVTITVKNVVYPELSDETEILTDAQAAICLGTNSESAVVFKVLVKDGNDVRWEASTFTATTNQQYDITLTFDYTKGTYSATVDGTALTAAGATSWSLCSSATSVSNIEFMGSGSIKGIQGTGLEGNMIEDGKGNKYATIQAAIDALTADATLAPLTKLHAGTPPEGWRFDGNTLIKIAKGMFFFAF